MAVLMHRTLSGATKEDILTPAALDGPTAAMRALADMTFTDKVVDDAVGSGHVAASQKAALWCFAREDTSASAILADRLDGGRGRTKTAV